MCDHTEHHHHSHGGHHLFGEYTELYFAILSGVFLTVSYGLSYFDNFNEYVIIGYLTSFFFGGFFTIQEALEKLAKGKFEIDFLMFVAACGAGYLGKWAEGSLLLFLFSLGHALEHYALGKAKSAISELGNLTPNIALIKRGTTFEEIAVENLKVGDVILVKAHEKIAADGVVVSGESSVNQAPITGESMLVDKAPMIDDADNSFENISDKHRVFAATLNGESPLEIKVLHLAEHSTLSRMIQMVSEAKAEQSPTQLITKKIEKYYVQGVLILVVLLCFIFLLGTETFQASLYRALSVLVASSPCALAISTPGAVLSGIAGGARGGVLFKGGGALENLGSVNAIAFDKTGTLTEGKPQVVEVVTTSTSKEELLSLAMSIERFSNHPLARAIVEYAKEFTQPMDIDKNAVKVFNGNGIEATINNEKIQVGKLSFLTIKIPDNLKEKVSQFEEMGYTLVGLCNTSQFLGIIALQDKPKSTAAKMLRSLRGLGIEKLVMLTGDQQVVANTIGKELGLTEVFGGLLPNEKVQAIQDLNGRYGKVAMIGDGVNDAPAMAASTVAVAMGAAGSDVALETADIALLSDNIEQIPFAVGLSRKAKQIIKQNLLISLASIGILIPLTIFNITGIVETIVLHEGTTIFVVLNALRLLSFKFDK